VILNGAQLAPFAEHLQAARGGDNAELASPEKPPFRLAPSICCDRSPLPRAEA
jgi:hypothetical protein